MDVDISRLAYYLQLSLGKQISNIEILENTMSELDKKGCDQISFTEVNSPCQIEGSCQDYWSQQ